MMKKILSMLAAVLTVFSAAASDEAQIIQTMKDFRIACFSFDFNKALGLCTADYVEYSPDGTRRTTADLRRMIQEFRTMERSNDLEEIMECAMKLQGATLNDAQRQQIRSLKGTPREAEVLAAVKQQLRALRTQMASMKDSLLKMIKFSNLQINGREASAVQEFTDPMSGKKYITHIKLRKVGNTWKICEVRQENAI